MRSSMVATLRLLFHSEEKSWQFFGQLKGCFKSRPPSILVTIFKGHSGDDR
jgi:hypothetical protein